MVKKRQLLLLAIIIISLKIIGANAAGFDLSLTIFDSNGPIINIISPINNSGIIIPNVTMFYSANDLNNVSNCSLVINNMTNASDNSITKDITLNISLSNLPVGNLNWSINCTDNLTFVGNSSTQTLSIIFMQNFNGSTTNISTADVRNLTNFTIEIQPYGSINYNNSIDLSLGYDLDQYINISSNLIELNPIALKVLNKSATLTFYGLSFTNPRVLQDGSVCAANICTNVSYSSGTFVFNVTQFTSFSAEETPTTTSTTTTSTIAAQPSAGGGGGGGGASSVGGITNFSKIFPKEEIDELFTIIPNNFIVHLSLGSELNETLSIKSNSDKDISISLKLEGLGKYLSLSENNFILQPSEEKKILLKFNGIDIGSYTGSITIDGGGLKKTIPIVFEVISKDIFFDVQMDIPEEYLEVEQGKDLKSQITIINIGAPEPVDLTATYFIKDLKGNVLYEEEEILSIENQISFQKTFPIDDDTLPEIYVAIVEVRYSGSFAVSSSLFRVVERRMTILNDIFRTNSTLMILLIIILIGIILISISRIYSKKEKSTTKTKKRRKK